MSRRVRLPVLDVDDEGLEPPAPDDPAPRPLRIFRRGPEGMGVAEAQSIAGALGHTSKMPGLSYGLDARRCVTGSALALIPGSVCRSCYARTDFYGSWSPVAKGHSRRHDGLEHPLWEDAMVVLIHHGEQRWFRWHDSGDVQSVAHLARIVRVCERTPGIAHWLPTREYEMVAAFLAAGGGFPENLCVRLSAHMIDTEPVVPPALAHLPTSTVHTALPLILVGKGYIECKAVASRANKCGTCRACWSSEVANVSYPQH